jgi:hypothetical protein
LTLRDWPAAYGVTQVTMEATGVFSKQVWAVLEDEFELLLVNARHVKQVPVARPRRGHQKALGAVKHSISAPAGTCPPPASSTPTSAATTSNAATPNVAFHVRASFHRRRFWVRAN